MLASRLRWHLAQESSSTPALRPSTAPFRRAASAKEVGRTPSTGPKDFVRTPSSGRGRFQRTTSAKNVAAGSLGWSSTGRLKNIFFQFTGGEMEMNQSQFVKFAKDCQVLNRSCSNHDIGVIFAKLVASNNSRKISYQQFLDGIYHCAQKRDEHMESLERTIMESGGLKVTGTVPLANRLHDDRIDPLSMSGMSLASTVDHSDETSSTSSRPSTAPTQGRRGPLQRPMTAKDVLSRLGGSKKDLLSRNGSSRNVFSRAESSKDVLSSTTAVKELKEPRPSIRSIMRSGGSFKNFSSTMLTASKELEKVFFTYSGYSSQMDRKAFLRFAEECSVVNARCTLHDLKSIFADVKTNPAAKAITYAQFCDAIKLSASKRQEEFEHLEKVIQRWAPSVGKLSGKLSHHEATSDASLRQVEAPALSLPPPDPVSKWDYATRGVKLDYVPLAPATVFQRLMNTLSEKSNDQAPAERDHAPCDPPPEPEPMNVFRNSMSAF